VVITPIEEAHYRMEEEDIDGRVVGAMKDGLI
jgi:hypothetical protein